MKGSTVSLVATPFLDWYASFEATRELGPVHGGLSRGDVKRLFGVPFDESLRWRGEYGILVYADLEFHFGPEGIGLCLLYREPDVSLWLLEVETWTPSPLLYQ